MEESEKIHVAILGTCCIRDIIGISDTQNKFNVDRFVQSNNPISISSPSPLLKDIGNAVWGYKTGLSNFACRNITLDFNKSAVDYVYEEKSEWLFIDVGCLRNPIKVYGNGGITTYFIEHSTIKNIENQLVKDGYLPGDGNVVMPETISDSQLYEYLDKFIERLLEIYLHEKIILFEIRPVQFCVMPDGTVSNFIISDRFKAIDIGYKYVKSKLPKAHVVEFPVNMLGDRNHKWGRYPLHYVKEYYDYAYEAVDKITGGGYSSLEEEKADLSKLRAQYERTIEEKYSPCFVKTIKQRDIFNSDSNKWRAYSKTFKYLIEKDLAVKNADNHLLAERLINIGYKTIAIYGDTEIAKVLVSLFKGTDVNIAYFVEDKPVKGFTTLKRDTKQFPAVDLMIVADVAPYEKIKTKLEKLQVPFKFVNAAEFLQTL